jgi:hypothetical protein
MSDTEQTPVLGNVYKRLQAARCELQKLPLQASGKNTYAEYTYLDLGDFLPRVNDICLSAGICGVMSYGVEMATLTIVNTDSPEEKIIFESPMSTAALKGCHAVQNLGAVQSYLRRYLWIAAFEIVEHDALDKTHGKPEPQQRQQAAKSSQQGQGTQQGTQSPAPDAMTEGQRKMIFAKLKAKNVSEDFFKTAFKIASIADLKKSSVNEALSWIDGAAQSA